MVAAPSVSRRRLSSTPGTARYSPPKIKLEPRSLDDASEGFEAEGTLSSQQVFSNFSSHWPKKSIRRVHTSLSLCPRMKLSKTPSLSVKITAPRLSAKVPKTLKLMANANTNKPKVELEDLSLLLDLLLSENLSLRLVTDRQILPDW